MPQNPFSFYVLSNPKPLPRILGIFYRSTPLPGTKIYVSFKCAATDYQKLGSLKQWKFIIS